MEPSRETAPTPSADNVDSTLDLVVDFLVASGTTATTSGSGNSEGGTSSATTGSCSAVWFKEKVPP